jgi:hypothetical protein
VLLFDVRRVMFCFVSRETFGWFVCGGVSVKGVAVFYFILCAA